MQIAFGRVHRKTSPAEVGDAAAARHKDLAYIFKLHLPKDEFPTCKIDSNRITIAEGTL